MRRRTATLLACGPLVAGCGTATKLRFAGHSRPATPLDISVYAGPRAVRLDPNRLRAGLVLFNIANESGYWERFSVLFRNGRLVAQTPPIANGSTAQLKATLLASRYALGVSTRRSGYARFTFLRLVTSHPARSGNGQLMQP